MVFTDACGGSLSKRPLYLQCILNTNAIPIYLVIYSLYMCICMCVHFASCLGMPTATSRSWKAQTSETSVTLGLERMVSSFASVIIPSPWFCAQEQTISADCRAGPQIYSSVGKLVMTTICQDFAI